MDGLTHLEPLEGLPLPVAVEVLVPPASSVLFQASTPPLPPPSHSSPSRSPRRIHTDPEGELRMRVYKRIIVCCDGTWQDGISVKRRSLYTNVLRLARAISREDERLQPGVPQIVFYQSGIGTNSNLFSEYVDGTTGGSLADKVEEAYAFIAHNYNPGDEIFLFGFSRGAYTARMVAMFVGEIGVLDPRDMDNFAKIFINFQKLGKCQDPAKKKKLEEKLGPWRSPQSKSKLRADIDNDKFTIKFLGVWDTVGALGLPEEVPIRKRAYNLFGFNDSLLGDHIERAVQALALNERRLDFNCNKFQQTEAARAKGQYIKQVWFAGCHTDIGGGYDNHDLSDLALIWMAGEVDKYLSLDITYLQRLIQPSAPWGTQQPHDSGTGIFSMAATIQRTLPAVPNDPTTHEFIHSSVLQQATLNPTVDALIKKYPDLICPLEHLEGSIKNNWPYDENSTQAKEYRYLLKHPSGPDSKFLSAARTTSWIGTLVRSISQGGTAREKITVEEPRPSLAAAIAEETRFPLVPAIAESRPSIASIIAEKPQTSVATVIVEEIRPPLATAADEPSTSTPAVKEKPRSRTTSSTVVDLGRRLSKRLMPKSNQA